MSTGRNLKTLSVSLVARTAQFRKGMKRAQRTVANTVASMRRAATGAVGFGTALTALVAGGGIAALTKQSFGLIDANAKTADRLGITTEKLIALKHAAGLAGQDTKVLSIGLQRMVRRTAEAAAGNVELQKAFRQLGLDAKDLVKQSPDEVFKAIGDRLRLVSDQAERVRLTQKLFDSEGVGLLNLLEMGSAGIAKIEERVKRLGLTVDRVDSAKIETANDAFFEMGQVARGLANQLAVQLSPFIVAASEKISDLATSGEGLAAKVAPAVDWIAEKFIGLGAVWDGLKVVWDGLVGGVLIGMASIQDVLAGVSQLTAEAFAKFGRFEKAYAELQDAKERRALAEELRSSGNEALGNADRLMTQLGRGESPTSQWLREQFNSARTELNTSVSGKKTQTVTDEEALQELQEIKRILLTRGGVRLS